MKFIIQTPQHLLKIASPNDSNTLNERFYKELLHIIGLEEAKEGTKNVIRRKKDNRNAASLIELAIEALKTEDTFHRIPDIKVYGENKEEQTFNIAFELCITWINRILFLKLLEGQLISYHQGNKDYRFLNSGIIHAYEIEIVNDELIITDQQGNLVEYKLQNGKPANKEVQRLQKTLFHQKETIIENCLFGVDINPKSVLICRLRLWIELLKNAYYKETEYTELETLPNIEINIKCGNSLLSRFALDSDLSKALKSIKYDIKAYRSFVNDYKNEEIREVKRGLQKMIDSIKSDFKTEISLNDPKRTKLERLSSELYHRFTGNFLFEPGASYGKDKKLQKKAVEEQHKLENEINKLSKEIEEIKTNSIYKNAFEWRFEFPEVLNNKGEFEGFDLIIGNPPYIKEDTNRDAFNGLRKLECFQSKMDIWYLFGDLGLKLLKPDNYLCYIATNNWVTNAGASKFRNIVIQNSKIINLTDFGAYMIFENASIQTIIMLFKKTKSTDNYTFDYRRLEGDKRTLEDVLSLLEKVEKENLYYLNAEIIKANLLNKTSAEKMKGRIKVGEGVFVLSQKEYDGKKFSAKEKEILKPYYTTKQLNKYYGNPKNTHWVIYTKSDINKQDKKTLKVPIDNYPKIKAHLDFFQPIITSAFAPYCLNRAREQYIFEGTKILAQRKCPKEPIFTYTEFDCFVSRAFVIIQSDRINMKYLTGLLNSKLVAFWLRKKGKMQGNAYQLDKEPLLEIPIYNPSDKNADEIAKLVDKIISLKQKGKDSSEQEKKIDELIYKLYDITADERKIIEDQ